MKPKSMIKQSIFVLFVLFSSTKAFAINNASGTNRLYHHRFRRSVSVSTPNLVQINNELSEWHLNENDSIKNDLMIGQCGIRDRRVYTDDILVENSGPSTLNGTIEIYVHLPIEISCVKVEDQIGTGALPSFNSGGPGYNWIFIDVKCKYGKGFHFKIHIFGETNKINTDIV